MKRKAKDDKWLIICALADSAFMVAGSYFDLICTRCARAVMIAPSGRKFLDEHPGMVWVICDRCFDPKGLDREAAKKGRLTAAPGVILQELMNVTVNYRGTSN